MKHLLLIVLVALCCSSCSTDEIEPPRSTITAAKDEPSQTGSNTRVSFSSSGVVRAVLNARGVRIYDQAHYTLLDSAVRVDFFDKDNKHSSVLTSFRAKINDLNRNMTAYDSVHITSDAGTYVETDSLLWENNTKEIRSDAFVKITEKNGRITRGRGFVSDQELQNYHILHPIIDAPSSVYQQPNSSPALSTPFKTGLGGQ